MTDEARSTKYHQMIKLSGLRRPGQHARVIGGKHYQHESMIYAINWSDGEVLMMRKDGEKRWWELSMVMITDPDYGPMPDLSSGSWPSVHPVGSERPLDSILSDSKLAQVFEDLDTMPEPQIEPVPATDFPNWIPKRTK